MNEPEQTPSPEPKRRVTRAEMEQFIRGLGPDSELYSGRKFFERLLEKKGIDGVLDFIDRGVKALDEQTALDPFYDFSPHEREILRRTPIKAMSRRAFLSVFPGAWFAGVEAADSLARGGSWAREKITGEPDPVLDKMHQWVEHNLSPSANLAIAVVVGNEMYELIRNWKLEQISDSITELHRELPVEQQSHPVASNQHVMETFRQLAETVENLRQKVEEQNAEIAALKGQKTPGR